MKRVTGIGGIFFKAKDPKALQAWYQKHLGLPATPEGYIVLQWGQEEGDSGYTVWSAMPESTEYYAPSQASFMINYRVENLDALLDLLREEGVEVVGEPEEYEYGKFGWIMDPEGNKVELWEPKDEVFREVNKLG
ncbi:MAG: VOC family protein [Phaeodactylibacter sp.]|nr:VOC family protein [Phaeodactylibacter sp.]MCB9053032.1 VOC family protein [Lewinellaceae bacterium]